MFEIPKNQVIYNAFIICGSKLSNINYQRIMASISGGSDSDLVIDIIEKVRGDKEVYYVWFNTGLEYQATKNHIKFLEEKYHIKIHEVKPTIPIPIICKKYGQPFLSKQVSEFIKRLQKHNFKWEDKPFEELVKEYPNCKSALKWWCNKWGPLKNGKPSNFDIGYHECLKEFMIAYPPKFKISNICCTPTKKMPAKKYKKDHNIQLSITGVRKSEGGARESAYKNCFTDNSKKFKPDEYRVVFWFKTKDKKQYNEFYNIINSLCYTQYGLKRTGCAGCPYGKDFEMELEIMKKYEYNLFKAACNIFKDSYEYTRAYRKYRDEHKK